MKSYRGTACVTCGALITHDWKQLKCRACLIALRLKQPFRSFRGKPCLDCEKPVDNDGRTALCHKCRNKRSRKAYNDRSPNVNRLRTAKKRYGIDLTALLEKQPHCGICQVVLVLEKRGPAHFVVDHDHATGQVRGLLCNNCNRAMGMFKDSPEILRAAIEWLERLV